MPSKINLLNQRFGKLIVIEETNERKSNSVVWKCECDCGNIFYTTAKNLRSGHCNSCGCSRKENSARKSNLIGQRFGKLTVIEETNQRQDNSIVWKCQCDCGNITYKNTHTLNKGTAKSCGCLLAEVMHHKKETGELAKDITNQRFGKVTALYRLTKQNHNTYYWHCKCDCGKEFDALLNNLTCGRTQSCGCEKSSRGETFIEEILKKENILFNKEFSFSNLKSDKDKPLKFDFYCPEKKYFN